MNMNLEQVNSGYLIPQAPEVEKNVLSAFFSDKDAFEKTRQILTPEMFYVPANMMVYQSIHSLAFKNKPIDVITVTEQLAKDGNLDRLDGGADYVANLSQLYTQSSNVEYYAKIIADKYVARQVIDAGNKMILEAKDKTIDIDTLLKNAQSSIFQIVRNNKKTSCRQIDDIAEQVVKNIQTNSVNMDKVSGVPTGFKEIDEITSGFQNGDVITIASRPAIGKTSFALTVAKNIAVDNKIPTLFFSLGMTAEKAVQKITANICEIPINRLLKGQLEPDERERLEKNISLLKDSPLYIDDTPYMDISGLNIRAQRLVIEKGIRIIFVDYLQLIQIPNRQNRSAHNEFADLMYSIKRLARDLDIPIVLLSQLNRSIESRERSDDRRPRLSDLRESGSIEEASDIVMFMHPTNNNDFSVNYRVYNTNETTQIVFAKPSIQKNVELVFRGEYAKFEDPETNSKGAIYDSRGGEIIGSKINDADSSNSAIPWEQPFAPF